MKVDFCPLKVEFSGCGSGIFKVYFNPRSPIGERLSNFSRRSCRGCGWRRGCPLLGYNLFFKGKRNVDVIGNAVNITDGLKNDINAASCIDPVIGHILQTISVEIP